MSLCLASAGTIEIHVLQIFDQSMYLIISELLAQDLDKVVPEVHVEIRLVSDTHLFLVVSKSIVLEFD